MRSLTRRKPLGTILIHARPSGTVFIGLRAAQAADGTTNDYLLAKKECPAWLAGLSAVATSNSGFMFIGMIGMTYTTGLSSIWLMIGWIAGDVLECAGVDLGVAVGAIIVLVYSTTGGLRASIWTDAAQSGVMLIGMTLLAAVGVWKAGGVTSTLHQLDTIENGYMNWFTSESPIEAILFVTGWFAAGFGVLGQPHVVVRVMSVDKPEHVGRLRLVYYSWFVCFWALTILVGLLSRILLGSSGPIDPEVALPLMATDLLPEILTGVVLASIFSATVSTADSLVLSCSAALTRDLFPGHGGKVGSSRLATVVVVGFSAGLALFDSHTVYQLVLLSWGFLASALAPVVFVGAIGGRLTQAQALTMILVGPGVCLIWRALGLGSLAYEALPGITSAFLAYGVIKLARNGKADQ